MIRMGSCYSLYYVFFLNLLCFLCISREQRVSSYYLFLPLDCPLLSWALVG
jgi:hypothetical protein